MKILVTGSDGFLGCNVVRELLKRKQDVIAFVFKHSNTSTLNGLDVKKYLGDLLNYDDILNASVGCDIIIHTAADTSIWPKRSERIRDINILGTKNAADAALVNGIKKFIFVGTANSFGFGTKENPGNESKSFNAGKYGLDYIDSKKDAQNLILNYVKTKNLPATIVNPTFMFGPYDSKPGPGQMLIAVNQGIVPGYTKGGRNFAAVKDVAFATCNAIEKGKIGECYICGNQNMHYKEILTLMADTLNVKAPKLGLPKFATYVYGYVSEFIYLISKKPPKVSIAAAKISNDTHFFDSTKARNELGLPQTPVKEALIEEISWLRENNYI